MESTGTDRRRAAGERTKGQLMDAALAMVAERGEGAVTLRELTDAAGANVAAVSYHFGSLSALCEAAIAQALERYLDAQQEAIRELDSQSTLEELAAAFARPMISALASGGTDLAVMQTVARTGLDPPRGWGRLDRKFAEIRADVLRVLRSAVPDVKDRELILRIRFVAGMLNWVGLAPVGNELRDKSEKQIERLLVPPIAGAFRGTSPS